MPGTPVATDALRDEIGKLRWRRKQLQTMRDRRSNPDKISAWLLRLSRIFSCPASFRKCSTSRKCSNKMQSELNRKEAELELLKRRFVAAEKIEEGLTRLRIRRQELLLRLKQDYMEQAEVLNRAIVIFEEVSSQLYEKPSKFTPTETPNGPAFKIEAQADRSPGIANMQIFCFDMMLARTMAERHLGPGFLVHDSHIFDPVDSRQVGAALEYASTMAAAIGIQYIVTLNSDKQVEFPDDFTLAPHLLATKLTDATENGGLFGLRFG